MKRHMLTLITALAVTGAIPERVYAAGPQATSYQHTYVLLESTSMTRASRWRTSGDKLLTERRFHQDLRLTWLPQEGGSWAGFAHTGGTFDLALPSNPEDPLIAERQLSPTLHSAWVRWRPRPELQLQLGRQLLMSPMGLARIDGARLSLSFPGPSLELDLTAGHRPTAFAWRLNDWSFQPEGDHDRRATQEGGALLAESLLSWRAAVAMLEVGFRGERAAGGTWLDRAIHLGAAFGRRESSRISAELRYHDLQSSLGIAQLIFESRERSRISGIARLSWREIVLPLDSPFAIYPLGASLEASSGIRYSASSRQRAGFEILARRDSFEGSPSAFALKTPTYGGLRVHYFHSAGALTHSHTLQGGISGEEKLLQAQHHLAWRPPRRSMTLQTGVALLAADSARALVAHRAVALSLSETLSLPVGQWGALLLQTSVGVDNRPQLTFATMTLLDLNFPWTRTR